MLRFRNVLRSEWQKPYIRMQRHHLLPLALKKQPDLAEFFVELKKEGLDFDDFQTNGTALPADEESARLTGCALHCGPHHHYNYLVMQRVRQMANHFYCQPAGLLRRRTALSQIRLLQRALTQSLIRPTKRIAPLHARDPYRDFRHVLDVDEAIDRLLASRKNC